MSRRSKITLTAILAGVTAVGGVLGYGVDWALKKSEQLGVEAAKVDTLRMVDSVLIKRLERAERKLNIQSRKLRTVTAPQKEGWLRSTLRKLF